MIKRTLPILILLFSIAVFFINCNDDTTDSINDLAVYLSSLPANTVDTPYTIVWNCNNLRKLGDTITDSKKFVNLDLSGSVITSIDHHAFFRCIYLTGITIPDSVTSIGDDVFTHCKSLTSVNIGSNVTSIGENVFVGCTSLTGITIPNGVISIGDYAFRECTSLTSINIGDSVASIGNFIFRNCGSLTAINVTEQNTVYSSNDGILYSKDKTALLQYPKGRRGVFTIPNNVTSIGDFAFSDCVSLTSVIIPNSVISIGYDAFANCTSLTNITIPGSVTNINRSAFDYCRFLIAIDVDDNNTAYSSIDGVLYNKGKTSLLLCPRGKTGEFTIPNSVSSIEYAAFYGCISVNSINIPNSIIDIEYKAFESCTGLTKITIPNGVTSIRWRVFYNCYRLTSLTIPASVISIGDDVFVNCTSLTSVTFEGTIDSSDFSIYSSFDGDLRDKFYAEDAVNGTPGTYTRESGTSTTWTRQ